MANEENKFLDLISDNAGTIAGAAQIGYGLLSANQSEEPQSNIADQLKNLSREVRMRAATGLDPGAKTLAENNIKNIQQNEIALIKDLSGGSVDVALANISKSNNRTHDALSTLAIKDAELKEKKELTADSMVLKSIEADEREQNKQYSQYQANENAISGLIGSGISNIVGESKLKKTNEQLATTQNENDAMWRAVFGSKDEPTEPDDVLAAAEEKNNIDSDTGLKSNAYYKYFNDPKTSE